MQKELAEEALASAGNSVESSDSEGESSTGPPPVDANSGTVNGAPDCALPSAAASASAETQKSEGTPAGSPSHKAAAPIPVPLPDFLANVAKFADALLFGGGASMHHHLSGPAALRNLTAFTEKVDHL